MRLHVLGLPHTEMTAAYSWCAFTDRTRTFAAMMTAAGWDVRLYGGESCDVAVTEHVTIATAEDRARWFPAYDHVTDVWNNFDPALPHWQEWSARAVAAIGERAEPGDILCLTMGHSQWPIAQALPNLTSVETGIGYAGVVARFRVFESRAWQAYMASKNATDDCRFYDAVIPRAWDVADFPAGPGDGGYALFVGRFIRRKGLEIAVEATRRAGIPLVMAGQGVIAHDGTTWRGIDIEVTGDHLSHVGVVGPEERARLMGGAVALFSPSIYLEPFGGVHAEAQLTGTPVITTDWGVYPETVENGRNGYRCYLLRDFAAAVDDCRTLDRAAIREAAIARWSTDAVAPQFTAYFNRLATLRGAGWYEMAQPDKETMP